MRRDSLLNIFSRCARVKGPARSVAGGYPMHGFRLLICLVSVVVLCAACRGDDEATAPAQAKGQLCADLGVLQNEVAVLTSLGPTDYMGELRDAAADVRSATDKVHTSAEAYDKSID